MSSCSSSGDPVAVQQETAGRKLSKAEKDAAKNALKGPQNALKSKIEALGGTVVNTYQSSYNGIKVRIARDKAAAARGAARRRRRASAATDAAHATRTASR